jgi:hypothetical protein
VTRSPRTTVLLTTAVWAGAAFAALLATLLLVGIAQQGRILPGTTVAGVDVGGQDIASARRLLTPALVDAQRHPVRVSTPAAVVLLDPRDVGLTIDVEATARAAFARGRGGWLRGIGARILAPVRTVDVAPLRSVDEARLTAWVEDLAEHVGRDTSVGGVSIVRDSEGFQATQDVPKGALRVDTDATFMALRAALLDGERRVRIVADVDLPPGSLAPVERLAGDVAHALARPLRLHDDGRMLSIPAEVLADLLVFGTSNDGLGRSVPTFDVPVRRVRALLGDQGRETFDRRGRDAHILTDPTSPTTLSDLGTTVFRPVTADIDIEPSRSDTTFVPELTAAQVARMIGTRQRVAAADLDVSQPDITTADVLGRQPTHLVGTFTTSHTAGPPRTVNIRLLAEILDDLLIAPGATFSINETSGPRRCEDGFVPAGTIIRGELVDTCGGGVSQIGTTVMNAAFFAGVELDQWQPHSFYISRYPAGREATLNFPDIDVRFTNDTESWMVMRASTTPDSVTVSIYGVPKWESVTAEHGERRSPTDFTRQERPTTAIAPGARRILQSGGGGFTIGVSRTRVPSDASGEVVTERWTTVYQPQTRIVEIGVMPSAAPSTDQDAGAVSR